MKTYKLIQWMAMVVIALALSACAGDEQRASTGEFIDDRSITARVKTELLKDDDVSGMAVNVDTYRGTVQLNGFVDSPEQVRRAEEIAKGVEGVNDVENNLSVKGQ